MSEFERGAWTTMAGVLAVCALILLISGSIEWIDALSASGLMAYIALLGKRIGRNT